MLWKGIHKFKNIQIAPGGASYGFGNYNTLGRTYSVNNITGRNINSGLKGDTSTGQLMCQEKGVL